MKVLSGLALITSATPRQGLRRIQITDSTAQAVADSSNGVEVLGRPAIVKEASPVRLAEVLMQSVALAGSRHQ